MAAFLGSSSHAASHICLLLCLGVDLWVSEDPDSDWKGSGNEEDLGAQRTPSRDRAHRLHG